MLVDFSRSSLDRSATLASGGASTVQRQRWREVLARTVDGRNPLARTYADRMIADLTKAGGAPSRVLVVGGGQIGDGSAALYAASGIEIIAFDIYLSGDVTFVADAHAIPLRDKSVDAVWVQSVLEHVLDPVQAVAEIRRVLKPGGLLFADASFLWPVNEGAYDYTRWTPAGFRWLLRDFDIIAGGSSSGPGTATLMALRYLLQSMLRSRKLGQIAAFPFLWLRLLDRLCDRPRALEAAGGLSYYARKAKTPAQARDLPNFYNRLPTLRKGELPSSRANEEKIF
ncbi:class I SAM-dependent methyltransferase [Croceibacterium xixiisoli]|uniref:class I SAM-dependent methyltransferase n=1 Tax=Croceibacterium xixiisoli TaxID=1476466 RepID=UPI002E25EFE2